VPELYAVRGHRTAILERRSGGNAASARYNRLSQHDVEESVTDTNALDGERGPAAGPCGALRAPPGDGPIPAYLGMISFGSTNVVAMDASGALIQDITCARRAAHRSGAARAERGAARVGPAAGIQGVGPPARPGVDRRMVGAMW